MGRGRTGRGLMEKGLTGKRSDRNKSTKGGRQAPEREIRYKAEKVTHGEAASERERRREKEKVYISRSRKKRRYRK